MKVNVSFLKTAKFWKEMVVLLMAMLVSAAAVYYFLLPSKLIMGSVSGLAMILQVLLANAGVVLKVSFIIFAINVVLLVLALMLLGTEVGLKTIVASLVLGPFMDLWDFAMPYQKLIESGMSSVMGDPWLDLLSFVLLVGIAQAILFRINASSGGLDIIAMIINKYLHIDIGTSVTVAGLVVCVAALLIHPFRMVMIGIIGTWFNGLVIDYFTASINKRKRVCIISPEYERLRVYITKELLRGCSIYPVKGGYTGTDGFEIQAILTQSEFANLMEYIRNNEIHAFTTAGNCSEVYGIWRQRKSKVSVNS